MKNIIRSLLFSALGMASLAWLSILLIFNSLIGPSADGYLIDFSEGFLSNEDAIIGNGYDFSQVSGMFFNLIGELNIFLLILSIFAGLSWSVASHYFNIDAPGKAKIYFIHWTIFTGIFVAILIFTSIVFTRETWFEAAQFISGQGSTIIVVSSAIFYFLVYYVGVLVGTARFARSSVLFANKLPADL